MAKEKKKNRVRSRVDELPEEARNLLEERLADPNISYREIAEEISEMGYVISKSSVGRYALRQNAAAQRLMEAQEQTRVLVKAIKKNPDVDFTDAGLHILMDSLIKRISVAQEEFDSMPLDKTGRLIVAISRTKAYKDKVKQDMKEKADLAFKKLEQDILTIIKGDPESAQKFKEILERAKSRMINDDKH
ncbi:MAG: DUF3486 family protein [Clostridiaceae bacterium]|nr:DUF3486 family protein [Clostridiaceae bacterium]